VTTLSGIVAVAAGSDHSIALKGDGTVWVWGRNSSGQLGLGAGTQAVNPVPVAVPGLSGVVAIAGGFYSTLALKDDGSVWAWGLYDAGAIIDGTPSPVAVSGLPGAAVGISAGGTFVGASFVAHAIALMADGTVWGWGDNSYGQLGDLTTTHRVTPVQVTGAAGVVSISAGGNHTLALKDDGSVIAWGYNFYGQLGNGTHVSRSQLQVVVAQDGAGSLDTNDWYLHLDPALSVSIPAALVPKMLAVAQISGSGRLDARVKYRSAEFGRAVNNYVLALVPPEFFDEVKSGTTSAAARFLVKDGGFVLAQLTPSGWTAVLGPLTAYSQTTASGQGGSTNILDALPLSSLPPGTRFCVGYGDNAQSMFGELTLKTIINLGAVVSSDSGTQCVPSGVYLDGQPTTSLLNSQVTFNASVIGAAPTGSLQFKDGVGNLLAPQALVPANDYVSKASITTSSLALGTHSISAAYTGDTLNPWGPTFQVAALLHEVSAPVGGSSVQLSGKSSSALNEEAVFTVLVVGNNPTGTVQFKDGAANLGAPVPIVESTTTLRISTLGEGTHSISAVYGGDGSNTGSTSNVLAHTVYATISTGISLSSGANPSTAGASVFLTAVVTGDNPTGNVTFRDGGASLGSASLAGGVATFKVPSFAEGIHALTAEYPGDANNQTVTSATLNQQVTSPAPDPPRLSNISTRGPVLTDDGLMIAGLVIGGPSSKTVVITVAGPSLAPFGIANPLANPALTLMRSSDQTIVDSNDDWEYQTHREALTAIVNSGFQPKDPLEPAIIATLAPGAYTAIVSGANGGTGVGLVAAYEVDHPEVPLINISTRGKVLAYPDVMIAGFVVAGDGPKTVVVNVAGPSLAKYGIGSPLANPTLKLVRASDQAVIASNNDWQIQIAADVTAIQNSGFQPSDSLEPAVIATLQPGAYTAIVEGVGGGTGVALVGVYIKP